MRLYVVLGLLAGCGRVGFDELTVRETDAGLDGALAGPCGLPAMAPPTITISGETLEYTMFNNMSQPIGPATISAYDVPETTPFMGTSSAPGGAYSLGVTTNGVPKRVALRYAMTGTSRRRRSPTLSSRRARSAPECRCGRLATHRCGRTRRW